MWVIRTHNVCSPYSASCRKVRQRYITEVERGVLPTHNEMEEWIDRKMKDRQHEATFSIEVSQDMLEASMVQDSMDSYYEEMTRGKEVHCIGTRTRKRIRCVICCNSKLTKVKVSCGHIFHRKCIDEWLRWKPTCPICEIKIDIKEK